MPCDGKATLSSPSSQDTPSCTVNAVNQCVNSSSSSHHIPLNPLASELQTGTHGQLHLESQVDLSNLKQSFFSRFTTCVSLYLQPCRIVHLITVQHQNKLTKAVVLKFILETFPAKMYLYFLLQLPTLYCSCVDQIIEEADKALPEIKKMAFETNEFLIQVAFETSRAPPACKKLTLTWESFIDSLMREWNTFNVILAILIVLHIQSAQTAEDPLTRYTALLSLMCALMSLLFGCTYIVHFGGMREPWKAIEWAQEAKKTQTSIWWNVQIMLAMPAIWLNWFIILCVICIMSFVWRSGAISTTPLGISDAGLLVIRLAITAVLGIGAIYGFLIITTFRRYRNAIVEEAWNRRIARWIEERDRVSFTQSVQENSMVS